jgi:hypothetical protein
MPPSLLHLLCLLLGPAPALLAQAGPYCGSDTPLSTPYFAPFHKRPEAAVGCQAASPAGAARQVHVLRLTGRLPEVFLDVSGEWRWSRVGPSALRGAPGAASRRSGPGASCLTDLAPQVGPPSPSS